MVTGLDKQPPAGAAALVRKMAGAGSGVKTIASALGTTDKTLSAWLRAYPDLQAAMNEGREQERMKLHRSLYLRATNIKHPQGMAAAAFLLKARHGYRENEAPEEGNRINILFNLPAALPVDTYVEVVKNLNGTRKTDD
jgi:hypothetical protein